MSPAGHLDVSWVLCTVSGGTVLLCALGLAMSAFILPPEDGYEFLDDPDRVVRLAAVREDGGPVYIPTAASLHT